MVRLPRRTVLGSAAAIWGLNWTEQIAMYIDNRKSSGDNQDSGGTDDYPRTIVIGEHISGAATVYHTAPHHMNVEVGIDPQQQKPITLELDTGTVDTAVVMSLNEVEELVEALEGGVKEVEQWREDNDPLLSMAEI